MTPNDTQNATTDDALVLALAVGKTYDEAAAMARLSRSTVIRRMKELEFRGRVRNARAVIFDRTAGLLADGAAGAAVYLIDLAENAQSENVRLGACRAVVDAMMRIREAMDVEERLSALEQRFNSDSGRTDV